MITSALLFAAGFVLGWRYGLAMLVLASGLLALAFAGTSLVQADLSLPKVLIVFAHLSAMQAGFLLGQYRGFRAGDRRHGTEPASEPDHSTGDQVDDDPEQHGQNAHRNHEGQTGRSA